jgi:hypothetical protein
MSSQEVYPVRVTAHLDDELSRWKWLIKWFLAIPHFFVLAFLWLGFFVMTFFAFFAILFTGRYPRGIFDYNVGVLRWSWRVGYYYATLGTDKYPPFTLQEDPSYPTHLTVDYPEKLSRGLVLIKWWLLAIPHYIIVGILVGGGAAFTLQGEEWAVIGSGLIGILAFIAGVILLFTGKYPPALFDLVMGFNRWTIRVAGYAGLMTDDYPPFRLDTGGTEPGPPETVPPAGSPDAGGGVVAAPKSRWTAGRVTAVVAGGLIALLGFGVTAAGGSAMWADSSLREDGFVTSPEERFTSDGYAIVSENIELEAEGADWATDAILGDIRIRIASDHDSDVFLGVGDTSEVRRYLAGSAYSVVSDMTDGDEIRDISGGAPDTEPAGEEFWVASTEGPGRQEIVFPLTGGQWSIVVMHADGTEGLSVSGDVGAEIPALREIAIGLLVAGILLLALGLGLIIGAVRRAGRDQHATNPVA